MIYLYSNTVVVFDTATAVGAAAVIVGVVVDFSFRRFEKDRERTRKERVNAKKTTTSDFFFF